MKLLILLLMIELHKTQSKYHSIFSNGAGKLPITNDKYYHYYGTFQFGTPA